MFLLVVQTIFEPVKSTGLYLIIQFSYGLCFVFAIRKILVMSKYFYIKPSNILRINYGTYNDAIFLDVTLYTRNTITEWKWRNKNEK
jgi:hypothetical protein